MTTLCALAQKYGTDKYPWYTPFYHLLLRDRFLDVRHVLEIGIGTPEAMKHVSGYKPGASLRMWRDYFPYATIIGLDKDPRVMFEEDRIRTYIADQGKPGISAPFLFGEFDLILDDGSHDPDHQLKSFIELFPLVAPGGLYIIEDVNGELPLNIPQPYQLVECHAPDSPHIGRLIVVSK